VLVANKESNMVTREHARRFDDDGFFILEGAVAPSDLEVLRGECGRLVDERNREMDRLGLDTLDLDHRGRRYFVHAYDTSAGVRQFLFSDLMAEVARAALGDTVYLFNEQYVRVSSRLVGERKGQWSATPTRRAPALPALAARQRSRSPGQATRIPANHEFDARTEPGMPVA
jgi:hypothetical protein